MKKMRLNTWLLAVLALIVGGCGQFEVYTDADPDMDVLIYKTFAWPKGTELESMVNPLLYNELTDKRIRQAIDMQLKKNGYVRIDSAADLKVHYHIVVKDILIERPDDPHRHTYSPYWLENGRNTQRYEEGTLIVDVMEAKSGNIIWRGWAVGVIGQYTITFSEDQINLAIEKIFEKYPDHPRP